MFFMASVAMAGEIYGTIEDAGKPVPADVEVKVTVAGAENLTAKTDKFGAYRIVAANKGKGTLSIVYKNRSSDPAEIISFDKATRYDWTVETSGEKTTLKRK
jgi:hypothetical protein